jgi:hypothetical protein
MHEDTVYRYMTAKWIYGYGLPLHVLSRLGVSEGSLLALFGSGMGKTAVLAAKRFGCRVVGVEIMPHLVQYAERKAEAENMENMLTFVHIDEEDYLTAIKPNFVFYESVLSFLPNPSEVLAKYFPSAERIGVLELSWLHHDVSKDKKRYLNSVFGGPIIFRHPDEWMKVFGNLGFEVLETGFKGLGLLTKFWDDLKADQLGTLSGIINTIYKTFTNSAARKYTASFKSFLKHYSGDLVYAYYIMRPATTS